MLAVNKLKRGPLFFGGGWHTFFLFVSLFVFSSGWAFSSIWRGLDQVLITRHKIMPPLFTSTLFIIINIGNLISLNSAVYTCNIFSTVLITYRTISNRAQMLSRQSMCASLQRLNTMLVEARSSLLMSWLFNCPFWKSRLFVFIYLFFMICCRYGNEIPSQMEHLSSGQYCCHG